jgi:phosphoglycolate phosphatase
LVNENGIIDRSNLVINKLLDNNKQIFVVSNNNQITREDLLKKVRDLNFNFTIDNILTSSYVTAKYLNYINFTKKAYVIGSEQLGQELTSCGIEYIGIGRDDMTDSYSEYFKDNYKLDDAVAAVIVSLDKFFNIPKLLKAMNYLKNPETLFIGTNGDVRSEFPTLLFPDAGPIISAVERASYRTATIVGKPSTFMYDILKLSADKERILMIGDRLSVDIAFGHNCGFKTLLVETGDNNMQDVETILKSNDPKNCELIPDFVIDSIGSFV